MDNSTPSSERDLIEPARRAAEELAAALGRSRLDPGTFPGYDIVRELHRGGQGVVYEAVQRSTNRTVAIKILHDQALAGLHTRARFEREVQILGRFRHPNIVAIHDSGTVGRRFFYVMDLIAGPTLDRFLDHPRPPVRRILEVFIKVCDAVNAAHLRGIIHRDLKPSNIRVDADGQPYVLDFGLAKLTERPMEESSDPLDMTETGQFVGSLPWASPEQVEGRPHPIDIRSDVYSLGVVLYRLLTGEFPYDTSGGPRNVLENIVHAEPTRPGSSNPAIDDEVETIVLKCLAKDCERRYQSAGDLARDIRSYLTGEPIDARRDSSWYVFKKTVGRHRTLAVATALIIALITSASIVTTVLWRRAEHERDKAEQVQRILRMTFESINPDTAQGRDTAVLREMMAEAERLVETELAGQPEVEADLRGMIGATYAAIGDEDKAETHLRAALAIYQDQLDGESVEAFRTMRTLAQLLRGQYHFGEAVPLCREVAAGLARILGDDDEETLQARCILADAVAGGEKRDEAEALYLETLAAQRRTLGESHPDTLDTMGNFARLLDALGRADEAMVLHKKVYEGFSRIPGASELAKLISKGNYGLQLFQRHELEEAERLLRESVDQARTLLGEDHRTTLLGATHLAEILLAQQRPGDAEVLLRESLESSRDALGKADPRTQFLGTRLAKALERQGKLGEAEQILQQRLDDLATIPDSERTRLQVRFIWQTNFLLARVLIAQDRVDAAEPFLTRVLMASAPIWQAGGLRRRTTSI